jgi:hypothetical protein
MYRHEPTGNLRFRKGWRGRLVLEAEFISKVRDPAFGEDRLFWQDAIADDLWRIRYHREHNKMEPLI